jgi:hypothetical protein
MAVDVGVDVNRPKVLRRAPGALGLTHAAFAKASPPCYIYYNIYITSLIFIYICIKVHIGVCPYIYIYRERDTHTYIYMYI